MNRPELNCYFVQVEGQLLEPPSINQTIEQCLRTRFEQI